MSDFRGASAATMINIMRTSSRLKAVSAIGRTSDQQRELIQHYYELGQEIVRRVASGQSIRESIQATDFKASEFNVYKAHKFATVVTTKEELTQYLSAAANGLFSWTHIIALIQVDESARRERLFRKCINGPWSPARLRREISKREPFQRNGRRQGRPFRKLKSRKDLHMALISLLERPYHLLEEVLATASSPSLRLSSGDLKKLEQLKASIKAVDHLGDR